MRFLSKMRINGHLSTSLNKDFAFKEIQKINDKESNLVLFEFNFVNGTKHGYCFHVNSAYYSLYPHEQELILHTGYFFHIDQARMVVDNGHEVIKVVLIARSHEEQGPVEL